MKFTPLLTLGLILTLTACLSIPKTNYPDTSALESPPGYRIKSSVEESVKTPGKGLGRQVSLSYKSTLNIAKNFDQAWIIVAKALDLSALKITDRNRQLGVYYVDYNPNTAISGPLLVYLEYLLSDDRHKVNSYQLVLLEKSGKVTVNAQIKPPEIDSTLRDDADKANIKPQKDGSIQLIELLYKTIRDNLLSGVI